VVRIVKTGRRRAGRTAVKKSWMEAGSAMLTQRRSRSTRFLMSFKVVDFSVVVREGMRREEMKMEYIDEPFLTNPL